MSTDVQIKDAQEVKTAKKPFMKELKKDFRKNYMLYVFLLPAIILVIVFSYVPMYGIVVAFQNYKPALGVWGSEWIAFDNFTTLFKTPRFTQILTNTLHISFYSLIAGFPAPIILALILNQIRGNAYKRTLQTVTYMPYFLSTVVMCGIIRLFLNPTNGLYGNIGQLLGFSELSNPLGIPDLFSTIYVLSGIWQGAGWGSIIYLAALSSIDPSLYEAATVDGANSRQKIWYIDLPSIVPTAVILLILNAGGIMNVGFEKIFLLQNDLNRSASEVIATYSYQVGLIDQRYGFSAAVGLFNNVINFILLISVNALSRRFSETSLW